MSYMCALYVCLICGLICVPDVCALYVCLANRCKCHKDIHKQAKCQPSRSVFSPKTKITSCFLNGDLPVCGRAQGLVVEVVRYVCLICTSYMYALYVRLICTPVMHAVYVCLTYTPCALYVCLICMPYMYALQVPATAQPGGFVVSLVALQLAAQGANKENRGSRGGAHRKRRCACR